MQHQLALGSVGVPITVLIETRNSGAAAADHLSGHVWSVVHFLRACNFLRRSPIVNYRLAELVVKQVKSSHIDTIVHELT